ncbi:MAG: LPS export ABC transporter periplasmic protein LptC [Gemmatimonadetes bacterium]|nr:LPS export ABC transporter periplasmic protein LptC [Gemmatimonadota bacterium]
MKLSPGALTLRLRSVLPLPLPSLLLFPLLMYVVGCSGAERPTTLVAATDTADQVIFGLNHVLTLDGVQRTRLLADTAYFYQSSQTARLRRIKVTFYSPEGRETSTLTADSGSYEWRTGDMESRGKVVAVTPDGRRLTTSVLKYRRGDQSIVGPEYFVFDAPDRHLEGEGFTSDPDFRKVVTQRPRRGTVGRVPLER